MTGIYMYLLLKNIPGRLIVGDKLFSEGIYSLIVVTRVVGAENEY